MHKTGPEHVFWWCQYRLLDAEGGYRPARKSFLTPIASATENASPREANRLRNAGLIDRAHKTVAGFDYADFRATMPFVHGAMNLKLLLPNASLQGGAAGPEFRLERLLQFWLIVFHCDQIIATRVRNLSSDIPMAKHRVAGHQPAFQGNASQQPHRRFMFIGLALHARLSEHAASGRIESTESGCFAREAARFHRAS
ncbi:hypothetical protein EC9_49020 [Rosistilla ulvae]|uniref:Uncharacterized protein n=1 Tax=Rosistilla ulvae TaxID=1930277 RepID=A0A517M723_9BACT|nr:hypothetical protein [Rosistilla ulvae]QDS90688.1 hypothetical protein EC9_49020 [Rosistilla ulvae]